MAKASAQITLHYVIDIKASYRYYLLQGSTLAKPSKPTAYPPSSAWDDTEPTYVEGSTNSLYVVDCTVFCNGTFIYSEVSLSTSYEAAKLAYNKAQNAENVANNAEQSATDAAKTATNYLKFSNGGLVVGNHTSGTLGRNVLIDSDSVDIRMGSTVLSTFGDNFISIGKKAENSTIELCGGAGKIIAEGDDRYDWNDSVKMESKNLSFESERLFQFVHNASSDGATVGEVKISADASYEGIYYDDDGDGVSTKVDDGMNTTIGLHVETDDDVSGGRRDTGISIVSKTSRQNIKPDYDGVYTQLYARDWVKGDDNFFQVYPDKATLDKSLYFEENAVAIFGKKTDGTTVNTFIPSNDYGNTIIGYDNYNLSDGNTHIYGMDVVLYSRRANSSSLRPYYRTGDSLTFNIRTAGYITSSKTLVFFTVPISRPLLGITTVTASSVNGFILRQNALYTHGSTADIFVTPTSYTVSLIGTQQCVTIQAKFTDVTNAVNNSPIGIQWSGKLTFE